MAAYQAYGESLIIDSGTAITCCYIDANGVYQGGAILPGLKIASQSLNNHTSKVPLIYVDHIDTLTGKSTKEAVQVGLYHGYRHLINGLIADYKQQFPNATVVGTGSGLDVYQDYLDIDHYDSELIFKGLSFVYQHLNRWLGYFLLLSNCRIDKICRTKANGSTKAGSHTYRNCATKVFAGSVINTWKDIGADNSPWMNTFNNRAMPKPFQIKAIED